MDQPMDLCALSRALNRTLTGDSRMVCTVVHERAEAGRLWARLARELIDAAAFANSGLPQHCARMADYEACPMAEAYNVGGYFADYSELSPDEVAASDPDAEALLARSRVVFARGILMREGVRD